MIAAVLRFASGSEAQIAAAYAIADQTTGYVLEAYKGDGEASSCESD